MRELKFEGPRPACRAIESLIDDIGDPLVEAINNSNLGLAPSEIAKLRIDLEKVLVDVFAGQKVNDLRDHIYALHERIK